jgi:hypothetical protein
LGRLFGGLRVRRVDGNDDLVFYGQQFLGKDREPIVLARRVSYLDLYVDAFYIADLMKLVPECLKQPRLEFLSENADCSKGPRVFA